MKQKTNKRKEKGITLIALVITIIIMLILVAVTISLVDNGNLFNYARNAKEQTKIAITDENTLADGIIEGKTIEEIVKGDNKTATFALCLYFDDDDKFLTNLECIEGETWGEYIGRTGTAPFTKYESRATLNNEYTFSLLLCNNKIHVGMTWPEYYDNRILSVLPGIEITYPGGLEALMNADFEEERRI